MALHRFARMGITTTSRMHAHLTDTTDLIGSQAACSSARDPGSMDFMDVEATGAAGFMDAAATDEADLEAEGLRAEDSRVEAVLPDVEP